MAKHCTRECPDGETECCIRLGGTYMTDYEKGYERGRDEIRAMKENTAGCCGCAFEHVEPWELPCRKCKRNSKDYWRKKCDLDEYGGYMDDLKEDGE